MPLSNYLLADYRRVYGHNQLIRLKYQSLLISGHYRFGAILIPFASFVTNDRGAIVIAEMGINHFGNFEIAKKIVENAKISGADAIKFQYRNLSRTYSKSRNEIGDEIVGDEINFNYLGCGQIIELMDYAHSLDIYAGISFFTHEDISDFGSGIENFDFFKIPSPELTNFKLIKEVMSLKKFVFISTGGHNEYEIVQIFESLPKTGWMPMHCVSNYPTHIKNAKLGYLTHLQNKWGMPVGFSSHDTEWAITVGALALGAKVIERHITSDKKGVGLDHSSSSDYVELAKICSLAKSSKEIFSGNSDRVANQGELINLQNLGRSYYAVRDLNSGKKLQSEDFEYRSPKIGLGHLEFKKFLGKFFLRDVFEGEPLSLNHFIAPTILSKEVSDFARTHKISIPVRVHDYEKIRSEFDTGFYEFHLSYTEVSELKNLLFVDSSDTISIHLPDYINPNLLFDPFSKNSEQKHLSAKVLSKVKNLVSEYQEKTNKKIIVVGSFSNVWENSKEFYDQHSDLAKSMESDGLTLCFQWLPPLAWYFGGSISTSVFNKMQDTYEVLNRGLLICMDTSHLLLGATYFDFDPKKLVTLLSPNIIHSHISDASGIDGEGMPFGIGKESNTQLILDVCDLDIIKVIEVWQGHVNNFEGFKVALMKLKELYEAR